MADFYPKVAVQPITDPNRRICFHRMAIYGAPNTFYSVKGLSA
jgi:hypothetical protein